MARRNALTLLLIIATLVLASPPRSGHAAAFGMTPSHVVGIWTNVNDCLIAVSENVATDNGWRGKLEALRPAAFEAKKPGDVLAKVGEFRAKLDQLRALSQLGATAVYRTNNETITPSHVFLNSGHVLNGLVDWLVRNSRPEQLVSPFYQRHDFSGKTPSDAFGMVDLAIRRLDAILARAKG